MQVILLTGVREGPGTGYFRRCALTATYTATKTMGNEPTIFSDWNTYVRDNMDWMHQQMVIKPTILLNDTGVHHLLSSNTETDANTFTIPAGFMSATGSLTFEMSGYVTNTSGGALTHTLKFYFGGTAVTLWAYSEANGVTNAWWVKVMIKNLTASTQIYSYCFVKSDGGMGTVTNSNGTFAVNTANAAIIKSTHQWSGSNALAISDIWWGEVEYAPAI